MTNSHSVNKLCGMKKALPSSGECGLSPSSSHSEIYQLVSVRDDTLQPWCDSVSLW